MLRLLSGRSPSLRDVGSESGSESPDEPLQSPRGFFRRRGGFNEKADGTVSPTMPEPTRPPALSDEALHSARTASSLAGAVSSGTGTGSMMPLISTLRLHRLKSPGSGARNGEADEPHASAEHLDRGTAASARSNVPAFAPQATRPAGDEAGEAGAELLLRKGSEAALALGAAPLSGFRSPRFMPRESRAPLSPRAPLSARERLALVQLMSAQAKDAAEVASEAEVAASCGELRLFCMRGPPLPTGEGGGPSGALHALPRSYWDACTLVHSRDGGLVCWPSDATPPEHLRFFCFPASLLERLRAARPADGTHDGFGFTFSFTASNGAVRYACAVTGLENVAHAGALVPLSLVLLCDWPMMRAMLDVAKSLFLVHQSQPLSRASLGAHARQFGAALAQSDAEVAFLMQHPLWLPSPIAPLLEACARGVAGTSDTVLILFLAALLERPLLLVSTLVARLMPVAAALVHTLSPLSYSGTFIPFLPANLHPEPGTLVNCSPTPFIIGIERHLVAQLEPLAPHVVVFDLDDGTLAGDEALAELRALATAPALLELNAELARQVERQAPSTGTGSVPAPPQSERALQATFLEFMCELLAPSAQPLLRGSGDPIDAARAAECTVAVELATDILRYLSTDRLPAASLETATRRVMQCKADALVHVCARQPQTRSLAFLAAALQSRTVREFTLAPAACSGGRGGGGGGSCTPLRPRGGNGTPSRTAGGGNGTPSRKAGGTTDGGGSSMDTGTFADAAWLAAGLNTRQSVNEHAMALDTVQALIEQRLGEACPSLLRSALLSPRTATFQQRFEVGVNETLIGVYPCALHAAAPSPTHSGLGSPGPRGLHGLRQGVLHVSTRHLCFEAALFASAYTKLPLGRVVSVEGCRDPLFHLIPNAIRINLDDGSTLVFASFQNRDEALALLSECVRSCESWSSPTA